MGNKAHIIYIGDSMGQSGGGGATNGRVVTVTNDYTVQPEDGVVLCDSTDRHITLTLPDSVLISENTLVIKDIGGHAEQHAIAIVTEALDTKIDWEDAYNIEHNFMSVTIRNNNSNFFVV